ncbi:MAG: hypothetical protein NTZ21_12190, partial [Actinobacteria bacterium]|nr:hypothetical protein [Actinomycetota bacterium]
MRAVGEQRRPVDDGGLLGQQSFNATVKLARRADVVTTSTAPLAERYRAAGIERIEVIENYLASGAAGAARRGHAAAGTPWLASPIGPYAGMGEAQGGRLVP